MSDFSLPAMSPARVNALTEALKKAKVYLEFGMGGSTILAARLGVPNVFAVDSSLDWVQHVTGQISKVNLEGRVKLLHADLGATGDWGYPKTRDHVENWPGYYAGPW
nr:hypothetical protein [Aquabacterium sp.]